MVGFASLVISAICGFTWLTVLIPVLRHKGDFVAADGDAKMLLVVVGSGIAVLFALLSLGLERPVVPATASLFVLAATENLVFPVLPFWTLALLGAWSAWAAVAYVAALTAAVGLVVRRLITGRVAPRAPLQFSRCPLIATLRRP
jgi:hypothetical protein